MRVRSSFTSYSNRLYGSIIETKSSTMLAKAGILTVHKAIASTSIFPSPRGLTNTPPQHRQPKQQRQNNISLHKGEPENPSRYSVTCRSPFHVLFVMQIQFTRVTSRNWKRNAHRFFQSDSGRSNITSYSFDLSLNSDVSSSFPPTA